MTTADADVRKPRSSTQTESRAHNSGRLQERSTGSKAAEAACRAKMQQHRELMALQLESATNMTARQVLAASAQKRSRILCCTYAGASQSPYAADFREAAIAAERRHTSVLRQRSGSAVSRTGGAWSHEDEDNTIGDEQVHRSENKAVEDALDTTRKALHVAAAENEKE